MKMETIDTIKAGVGFATAIGASAIVSRACGSMSQGTKGIMKICCLLGGFGLSGIASVKAGEYMERTIDETVEICTDFVNALKGTDTKDEEVVEA